jgi:putative metallohydrolase (TIGR04338 family)
VRSYIARVLNDHRVTAAWGFVPPVGVRSRAGESMAHYEYETATIAMPTESAWAMRELVVLHEVAHHITARLGEDLAPHGSEFASIYVALVSWFIGPEVALLLTAAFDASGVGVSATVPQ